MAAITPTRTTDTETIHLGTKIPKDLFELIKDVNMEKSEIHDNRYGRYASYKSVAGYQLCYKDKYWNINCIIKGEDYDNLDTNITVEQGLKNCSKDYESEIHFRNIFLVTVNQTHEARECLKEARRIGELMSALNDRAMLVVTALSNIHELKDDELKKIEIKEPIEFLERYCARVDLEEKMNKHKAELTKLKNKRAKIDGQIQETEKKISSIAGIQ